MEKKRKRNADDIVKEQVFLQGNYSDLFQVYSRDEDPDPLIFGPPDPDPSCNNGLKKNIFILNKI